MLGSSALVTSAGRAPSRRPHRRAGAAPTGSPAFADPPVAGDAVLFGLTDAGARLRGAAPPGLRGRRARRGPDDPPLVWEAWTGDGWVACEVDTRRPPAALNRAGDVVLHVPAGHAASLVGRQRAGWLRCRLHRAATPGSRSTSASPRLRPGGGVHDRRHGRGRATPS